MKNSRYRKVLVVVIIVLFIVMSIIPSIQVIAIINKAKENISPNQELKILKSNVKLINIPISSKKIEQFSTYNMQTEIKTNTTEKSTNKLHPALARTDSGIHMAAYFDEELEKIIWTYSNDDGRTYEEGLYSYFDKGDYPDIDYWDQRIFCGTFITDPKTPIKDVIYFVRNEDIRDPDPLSLSIYAITPDVPHALPFSEMRDAAIACDNVIQNSYYWGAASYTINVSSLNNVPLLLYPEIPSIYLFRMSYYPIENCHHTDIDIDRITHKIFAVYDCNDTSEESWKLYVRIKDFLDLENGYDDLFELQGAEGLQYPVIVAHNDTVLILAESEENGNSDIVCLRSSNGLNTFQKSFLTLSGDDERFPNIEYVTDNTFICTILKNEKLYKMQTEDGGLTWSDPILIDTDVVMEYKTTTISKCASQVLYEKNLGEYIDLSISPLRNYTITPDIQIPSITGRDEIKATLLNNGGSDESNIYWWLNISGAINQNMNGIIPLLKASETFTTTIGNLNGQGNITIQATFESPNRQKTSREIVAYLNNNYIEDIRFLWDDSKTIYVDDDVWYGGNGSVDNPYKTIFVAGKWASSHGDTIRVANGTYYAYYSDSDCKIPKSVRLIGEDKNNTFIEQGNIIHTACGNVHTGFTHQSSELILRGINNYAFNNNFNSGDCIEVRGLSNYVIDNYIRGKVGINLRPSSGYHIIKNNIIENCSSGILLWDSTSDNVITSNLITNNGWGIIMNGGISRNKFTNNLIEDNNNGVSFNYLHDSVFINNIIYNNDGKGLSLQNSNNNFISYNIIQSNNPGIYLEDSSNNRITNNNIITNVKSATFHHNDKLYSNVWSGNYWGMALNEPKIIDGKIKICVEREFGSGDCIKYRDFLWINIDWSPAKEPYDIPDTNNTDGCDIDDLLRTLDNPFLKRFPLLNLFLQRLIFSL